MGDVMKKLITTVLFSMLLIFLAACGNETDTTENITENKTVEEVSTLENGEFTKNTKVWDVINDPVFDGYGRLIFPADVTIDENLTLENVDELLKWYNCINPDKTVEIVNYMKSKAENGEVIFYDIYTDKEKQEDPQKANTGLFFFKGNPGEKTAITTAGGGFEYVGAMHDSFPLALELSKKGYNAFAIIYRPSAETGCQDLSRAVAFIHEHSGELDISADNYSLWGGSAGATIVEWVGAYGTAQFGAGEYPKPSAVIMQYMGVSGFPLSGDEAPTYACVGTADTVLDYTETVNKINAIKENGTAAEVEVFDGLPHGFGIGEGTVAEGWVDNAAAFWESMSE